MELSVNLSSLSERCGIEGAMALYRTAGFDAVDFYLAAMTDDNNLFCTDDWRKAAEDYRAVAEGLGFHINQTHSPFRFPKQMLRDENYVREKVIPRLCRSIEVTAALGAKVTVVHPLHYLVYQGHEEENFALNMRFLRSLLPTCRDCGVQIAVENMWQRDPQRGYIITDVCNSAAELVRYVDGLDSDYARACLDIGHTALPIGNDSPAQIIRTLGKDRLAALHVHDNNCCDDQHMPPYFGKIHWAEVTQALGEIDYRGDLTYELNAKLLSGMDEELLPTTLRYLADIGRHLIRQANRAKNTPPTI